MMEKTFYQFTESDSRWGHVGYFRPDLASLERHLVLYDLAELDIFQDVNDSFHEEYVQKHITDLYNRGIGRDGKDDLPKGFFANDSTGIQVQVQNS